MKKLVAKIKKWIKDSNDRKYREFIERTRIKMENHENNKTKGLEK